MGRAVHAPGGTDCLVVALLVEARGVDAQIHSFFAGCTMVAGLLLTTYGLLLQTLAHH